MYPWPFAILTPHRLFMLMRMNVVKILLLPLISGHKDGDQNPSQLFHNWRIIHITTNSTHKHRRDTSDICTQLAAVMLLYHVCRIGIAYIPGLFSIRCFPYGLAVYDPPSICACVYAFDSCEKLIMEWTLFLSREWRTETTL